MKFSAICVAMNRNDRARDAVANWLEHPEVEEIVMVDWSSSPPLELPADPRVRLVRVEGEPFFILTIAYNLAALMARGTVLLKLDVDYRMRRGFLDRLQVRRGLFDRGKSKLARDDNERRLCGFMAIRKDEFWRVGGYNERLQGYGMDDIDLYARLRAAGMTEHWIRGEMGIEHVPHDDELRAANMRERNIVHTNRRNRVQYKERPWQPWEERARWEETSPGVMRRVV